MRNIEENLSSSMREAKENKAKADEARYFHLLFNILYYYSILLFYITILCIYYCMLKVP